MKIRFTQFGMHGYTKKRFEDISIFIEQIPYLLGFKLIPSRQVLNSILKLGYDDAGMSGASKWRPFQLDANKHKYLVKKLLKMEKGYRYVEPPSRIKNHMDWTIWYASYTIGFPLGKALAIQTKMDIWTQREKQANRDGDSKAAFRAWKKAFDWTNKYQDVTRPYIEAYHKKKRREKSSTR